LRGIFCLDNLLWSMGHFRRGSDAVALASSKIMVSPKKKVLLGFTL
jgi:hypothetical protein